MPMSEVKNHLNATPRPWNTQFLLFRAYLPYLPIWKIINCVCHLKKAALRAEGVGSNHVPLSTEKNFLNKSLFYTTIFRIKGQAVWIREIVQPLSCIRLIRVWSLVPNVIPKVHQEWSMSSKKGVNPEHTECGPNPLPPKNKQTRKWNKKRPVQTMPSWMVYAV